MNSDNQDTQDTPQEDSFYFVKGHLPNYVDKYGRIRCPYYPQDDHKLMTMEDEYNEYHQYLSCAFDDYRKVRAEIYLISCDSFLSVRQQRKLAKLRYKKRRVESFILATKELMRCTGRVLNNLYNEYKTDDGKEEPRGLEW